MTNEFDKSSDNKPHLDETRKVDINAALRSETPTIFSNELKADNATEISNETTINTDTTKNTVPNSQWLEEHVMKLLATSSPIIFEYHKSEIENVNSIITYTLSLVKWVSILTIVFVALFAFLEKDTGAILSLITGGIIDVILGVLMQLFNTTLKSKKSYFDVENDSSKFNIMLLLVQKISDQGKKDSVIEDILRKYFDISDKK